MSENNTQDFGPAPTSMEVVGRGIIHMPLFDPEQIAAAATELGRPLTKEERGQGHQTWTDDRSFGEKAKAQVEREQWLAENTADGAQPVSDPIELRKVELEQQIAQQKMMDAQKNMSPAERELFLLTKSQAEMTLRAEKDAKRAARLNDPRVLKANQDLNELQQRVAWAAETGLTKADIERIDFARSALNNQKVNLDAALKLADVVREHVKSRITETLNAQKAELDRAIVSHRERYSKLSDVFKD